ncbi:MAG: ice-binding family protein [Candidatus Paceibacterota bacterium]|jgi:hypothetical protein
MKFKKSSLIIAGVFSLAVGGMGVSVVLAATTINLGSANTYAVLGGSAITNTGASVINGDLGLSPGSAVTGIPPATLNGTQHIGDAGAVQAESDLTTAYNAAAGQSTLSTISTELGGSTKTAGVYDSAAGTFGITGTLTLDAQGDPNAVFIFKTASTLITAGASNVVLANGAQACNVFWQVGSSATLGTNSTFKGNILALQSATLTTGANVEGRVLARNGAVTLDSNMITKATCAVVPPAVVIPPPASTPVVVAPLMPPLISVKKVPSLVATLPAGGGTVAFDYAVSNVGTVAMSNITINDDKCSPVTFISGDTNGDLKLDVTETWNYRCTQNITQTTTNSVVVTGQANGFTATDSANAIVNVGVATQAPLIHLIKTPNLFVLPRSGPVTYTYTVTNPGTVPLNNVSVVDDKCSPVSGYTGDVNNDNLLDLSETWAYSCQMNLTSNTVNTATAEGSASGLTAIDYALATVLVTPPTLPKSGFGPDYTTASESLFITAGVFATILTLFAIRKKQVI